MFFHPSDHSMMLVVFVFCCCGAVCRGPKWFMDLNCAFFSFGFSLFSNAPNLLLDVSLANTYTHKKPSRGWSWIQTLWTMGSQPVRYWQLLCKNLYKSKSAFKKEIKKKSQQEFNKQKQPKKLFNFELNGNIWADKRIVIINITLVDSLWPLKISILINH